MKTDAIATMVKCPTCLGSGKQTIQSTTISPGKPVVKDSLTITCVTCHGKRKITSIKKAAFDRAADLWCSCATPSENPEFHNDFECRDCQKHHWHCGNCGKIQQVG